MAANRLCYFSNVFNGSKSDVFRHVLLQGEEKFICEGFICDQRSQVFLPLAAFN